MRKYKTAQWMEPIEEPFVLQDEFAVIPEYATRFSCNVRKLFGCTNSTVKFTNGKLSPFCYKHRHYNNLTDSLMDRIRARFWITYK